LNVIRGITVEVMTKKRSEDKRSRGSLGRERERERVRAVGIVSSIFATPVSFVSPATLPPPPTGTMRR